MLAAVTVEVVRVSGTGTIEGTPLDFPVLGPSFAGLVSKSGGVAFVVSARSSSSDLLRAVLALNRSRKNRSSFELLGSSVAA